MFKRWGVNARDADGWTELHFAAAKGDFDTANRLIAEGAQVNARDIDGETPLHCTAYHGHADIADLLLLHHAHVNAHNDVGETPLNIAVHEGQQEVADVLRQWGGREEETSFDEPRPARVPPLERYDLADTTTNRRPVRRAAMILLIIMIVAAVVAPIIAVFSNDSSDSSTAVAGNPCELQFREVLDVYAPGTAKYDSTPVTEINADNHDALKDSEIVLLFAPVAESPPQKLRLGPTRLTGDIIQDANAQVDRKNGGYSVNFTLNAEAADAFAQLTTELGGRQLAIVLDYEIQSAPRIDSTITNGSGQITGAFNAEQAKDLARALRAVK